MTLGGWLARTAVAWWLVAVCGLWALASSAPAAAADLQVRDDRGTLHRFARAPQRIVSLLPSLTESVCVLGACDRLVGVDRFSDWPEPVKRLPRLGGLEDAPIEAIVALRPDVVLASTSARALDRLEALGVVVLRLKSETHADTRRTLGLLAGLLGLPAQGEQAVAETERALAEAAARVPLAWRGQRVYFELGGGPYAAGAASFIGETLARLGLANIVPPTLGPFPKLNPEFVLRAQPQLLMGLASELQRLPQRPGWSTLPAVQQQRWCGFSSAQYDRLTRPGPRLGEGAALVADCLQRLAPPASP